jgi:transposase-like protein
VHKTVNVLDKVPLSVQANMKKDLREVYCKRRPRPIRKDLEGRIATRWRHGLQIR